MRIFSFLFEKGIKMFCDICNKDTNHITDYHKCRRCNLYGHSAKIHKCDYCNLDHTTSNHPCKKCGGLNHPEEAQHNECTDCGYILINHKHILCNNCKECTLEDRKHLSVCKYCGGCMAHEYSNCCDCDPKLRCIKCYKTEYNPDEYSLDRWYGNLIRVKKI